VATDRSHAAIVAVGPQTDGKLQASIAAYAGGTNWVPDRMEQLRDRRSPLLWAIEDKGATASLWPEIEKRGFVQAEDRDAPNRGEIVVPWAGDVVAAYGMFMDALVQRRSAHLDE